MCVLINERDKLRPDETQKDICDRHKNILHANATLKFSLPPCLLLNYVKCLETNHYSCVCYFISCFFSCICTPPVSELWRAETDEDNNCGLCQNGTLIKFLYRNNKALHLEYSLLIPMGSYNNYCSLTRKPRIK